jgi:hypothetical protein
MNSHSRIAAAVAAVLAASASGYVAASQPSPSSAQSPNVGLYIAGSSAAKNAVLAALETDLCGGSYSLFSSSGDTNFFAVSCTPSLSTVSGANGTNVFTVWYRDEGGSVVGAIPAVTGSMINQLLLTAATGTSSPYVVSVPGSSAANGIDDSYGTGTFKAQLQLGITDVEPAVLVGDNYPSAYKTSVYGTATAGALGALSKVTLFDQVFGIFVNTSGTGIFSTAQQADQGKSAANTTGALSIPKSAITDILTGGSTDWNVVEGMNGSAISSNATTSIVIVNREQGSGSRTATSIYFTGDGCGGSPGILESTGGTADYFSTGNVLSAANLVPGSITYASIDNAGSTSFPNLTLVAVNGIVPTNAQAANGPADEWYEATFVTPSYSGFSLSADQTSLVTFLTKEFQAEATAPNAADNLVIPGKSGNAATLPPVASRGIYVNPYTRGGSSCNAPSNSI